MKTFITNPKLRNCCDFMLRVGCCELNVLLSHEDAKYYNGGIYGWNFDVYTFFVETKKGIKSVALSKGYRNTQGKVIDSQLVKEYDKKANEIIKNNGFSAKNAEQLKVLINELILKVIE
jgi:hypothetical protein